ncbi:putative lysophospholipase BODYGUARD 1 [Salvia divinorum]|uniref:Lysophospholipase BODYGUARD 1 n=1 Tax=Salvia divinorum TaxID=28513 RepID=A0ABD1GY40_SALDI
MAVKDHIVLISRMGGRLLNEIVSVLVFIVLDMVDFFLCYAFKIADFLIEAEWKPCYCSSAKEAITSSGKILVSEEGESKKIVRVSCSRLQLEEISDTLYTRPSFVSEVCKSKIRHSSAATANPRRPTFTVNPTIVEMLQGRIGKHRILPAPRWSDCDCESCTSWTSSSKETLYVKADGAKDDVYEDVLFIHGFISSSAFWSETLYPNFSKSAKTKYRFLAVDLLGFGRSPKPNDSLYTLREHLEMIERSVLEPYKVKSFHIVAHSLGCILALALAVKHTSLLKSLTLLAPPYFPAPKGVAPAQYTMRRIAPRRVWPVIAFGASIGCWYEHISRTACLVLSKNHRLLEFLTKLLTRNRMRTYLIEGFFTHTHNAAWHTLHNIICGSAAKVEGYLEEVKTRVKCNITIFHGKDDELIPIECSYDMQSRIPQAQLKVVENKDHLTIVVGRQKAFARELEEIWKNASGLS